jgi:hypothetical protein
LRDEDSVFEHESVVADFSDDSRSHFAIGEFTVDETISVDTKLLNGIPVGNFFRSQRQYRPWEAAASAGLHSTMVSNRAQLLKGLKLIG